MASDFYPGDRVMVQSPLIHNGRSVSALVTYCSDDGEVFDVLPDCGKGITVCRSEISRRTVALVGGRTNSWLG